MASKLTDTQTGESINYLEDQYKQEQFNPDAIQDVDPIDIDDGGDRNKKQSSTPVSYDMGNILQPQGKQPISIETEGFQYLTKDKSIWDEGFTGTNYEDLERYRSGNQPQTIKALYTIGGGAVSGLGTAIEDAGYLLDYATYASIFSDVDFSTAKNMNLYRRITKGISDIGTGLKRSTERDIMPVYERKGDGSYTDMLFSWSSLKSIMDSAIGFGLTGLGTGALIKGIAKGAVKGATVYGTKSLLKAAETGAKAGKFANTLAKTDAYIATISTKFPQLFQNLGAAGTAVMTKSAEARMEGLQAYESYLQQFQPLVEQGVITQDELEEAASENASTVFDYTMATGVLDFLVVRNMFKGKEIINKKLAVPNIWNRNKGFLAGGFAKEGFEEMLQEAAQKEGEYGTYQKIKGEVVDDMLTANSPQERVQSGLKYQKLKSLNYAADQYPERYAERFANFLFSKEALVAGTIGAISGPVQAKIVGLPGNKARKAQLKQAYEEQQQQYKNNVELFTKASNFKEKVNQTTLGRDMMETAVMLNDDELASLTEEVALSSIVHENLLKGTTDQLKEIIREEGSPEAATRIAKVEEMEKDYKSSKRYVNSDEMFNLRQNIRHTEKLLNHYRLKANDTNVDFATRQNYNKEADKLEVQLQAFNDTYNTISSFSYQSNLAQKQLRTRDLLLAGEKVGSISSLSKLQDIKRQFPELSNVVNERINYLKSVGGINKKSSTKNKNIQVTNNNKNTSPDITTEEGKIETASNKINNNIPLTSEETTTVKNNPSRTFEQVIENQVEEETEDVSKDNEGNKYSKKSGEQIPARERVKNALRGTLQQTFDRIADSFGKETIDVNEDILGEMADTFIKAKREGKPDEEAFMELNTKAQEIYDKVLENPKAYTHDVNTNTDLSIVNHAATDLLNKLDSLRMSREEDEVVEDLNYDAQRQALKEAQLAFDSFLEVLGDRGVDIRGSFKTFIEELENASGNVAAIQRNFKQLKGMYMATFNVNVAADTYQELMNITEPDPSTEFDEVSPEKLKQANEVSQKYITFDKHAEKIMEIYLNDDVEDVGAKNITPAISIAHLSRDWMFEKVSDNQVRKLDASKKTSSNPIINPNKYNSGTPIKMELHEYDGNIRIHGKDIPWSEIQEVNSQGQEAWNKFLQDNKLEPNLTIEDFWPIKITAEDGEILGHVHQTTWVNKLSTPELIRNEQKVLLSTFRKNLIKFLQSNPGLAFETNITEKVIKRNVKEKTYSGFALQTSRNLDNTTTSLPDNLSLGIKVLSDLDVPGKESIKKNILNKDEVDYYPSGIPFVFVPVGEGKYHAAPLYSNKLTENQSRTITQLIQMYINQDSEINPALYNAYNRLNIDVLTNKGLDKVLRSIIKLYNPLKQGELDQKLYSRQGKDPLGFLEFSNNSIKFGKSGVRTLKRGTPMTEKDLRILQNDVLPYMFVNINRSMLNKNDLFNFVEVDENNKLIPYEGDYNTFVKQNTQTYMRSTQLDDGSYSSTLQNIVTFNIKEFARPEVVAEQETTEVTDKAKELATYFKQTVEEFLAPVTSGKIEYDKYIAAKERAANLSKISDKHCK